VNVGRGQHDQIRACNKWLSKCLARFYHCAARRIATGETPTPTWPSTSWRGRFSRAIELDPEYADAYFCRGVLYWREVRNAYRAIRDMTRVLELAPQRAEALFNRAMAHQMRGDHDLASPIWSATWRGKRSLLRERPRAN